MEKVPNRLHLKIEKGLSLCSRKFCRILQEINEIYRKHYLSKIIIR